MLCLFDYKVSLVWIKSFFGCMHCEYFLLIYVLPIIFSWYLLKSKGFDFDEVTV